MRSAQVKVQVRRRKPVKVRPADGGEQQRIRLRCDDAVEAWVNGHVQLVQILSAKAESLKENSPGQSESASDALGKTSNK